MIRPTWKTTHNQEKLSNMYAFATISCEEYPKRPETVYFLGQILQRPAVYTEIIIHTINNFHGLLTHYRRLIHELYINKSLISRFFV